MFERLRSDIACILERDPAARSKWEVLTCYPGLHAIWIHKLAHWFWLHELKWLGRYTSHVGRWLTGIEIHQLVEHSQELDRALRALQAKMAEIERAEAARRDPLRAVK